MVRKGGTQLRDGGTQIGQHGGPPRPAPRAASTAQSTCARTVASKFQLLDPWRRGHESPGVSAVCYTSSHGQAHTTVCRDTAAISRCLSDPQ